MILLLMS